MKLLCMFKIAKGYDTVAKTIRLPIPFAEKLEILAAKNNLSFNQLIVQCLQFSIDNLLDEDCKRKE